jgi:hypothetical protein
MMHLAWISVVESTSTAVPLELLKFFFNALLLALGWFFGQKVIADWDLIKKRQEVDVLTASEFQTLYGELKEVARIWRESKKSDGSWIRKPDDLAWQLLGRAAAVESKFEAVIIKLATERSLSASQRQTLGLFRQACQRLRLTIRTNAVLDWGEVGSAYLVFNELAAEITWMIGEAPRQDRITLDSAKTNLMEIAKVRGSAWDQAVASHPPSLWVNPSNPSIFDRNSDA